jgi:hypothetical protein
VGQLEPPEVFLQSFVVFGIVTDVTPTDKRTRLMSELLNNIKRCVYICHYNPLYLSFISIKLYAWEDSFIRRILTVRNEQELKMLRKIGVTTVSRSHFSLKGILTGFLLSGREHNPLDWDPSSSRVWLFRNCCVYQL